MTTDAVSYGEIIGFIANGLVGLIFFFVVYYFKKTSQDITDIDTILREHSVRLAKIETQTQFWKESYDRSMH